MIKKVVDFIRAHRHTLTWTVCYFACMWTVLRVMFGFNMLSMHDWWRLTYAHIHGFAGFVFMILILAMVPMYTATTMVIARTGAQLFKIPLPKMPEFLKRIVPAEPVATPAPTDDKKQSNTNTEPEQQSFPANMPNELKAAFRHARQYNNGAKIMAPKPIAPKKDEIVADANANGFPLPDDFDFEPTPDASDSMPVFKDIDFKDIDFDTPSTQSETMPAPETPDDDTPDEMAALVEHLNSAGRTFARDGDIITVDDMAIAAHCDNDFWIADSETWFATGKSKSSPIAALQSAASRGLKPVLFLGANNIMDIETLRDTWSSDGIRIITSPDEL